MTRGPLVSVLLVLGMVLGLPLVAVAGSAPAIAQTSAPSDLRELPELAPGAAVEEAVRRDLERARRVVEDARRTAAPAPELAAAYGELGGLYAAYELWNGAAAALANARRLAPGEPRWAHLGGWVEIRRGDLTAALPLLEAAAAADGPRDHRRAALLHLGETALALDHPEAARRAWVEAQGLGESAAGHFGLGRLAAREGDAATAVRRFEATLDLAPDATQVHYPLALALRRLGRVDEARRHLALRGEGLVPVSDPLVASLGSGAAGGAVHKLAGDQAILAGRLDDAVAAYRRAVEADPESFYHRKSLGLTLYETGRRVEAREQLEAALELDPFRDARVGGELADGEKAKIRFALGGIAVNAGDDATAEGHLRESLALAPSPEAHLQLGNLLGRRGERREALEHFDAAVALAPDDLEARTQRATTLMDLGRFAEAVPELERLLTERPGDPRLDRLLEIARREAGGG